MLKSAVDKYNNMMNQADRRIVTEREIDDQAKEIYKLCKGQQLDFYSPNYRVAVVLDDCGYQPKQMKNKESALSKLVMIRRHLGLSIFAALQSYVQIDKDIRRQCSDIFITKKTPNEDIKALYSQLSNLPNKDIVSQPRFFTALVEALTQNQEFGSVQFLHGGLYHDFNPVSREQMINIIRTYEQTRRDLRARLN